MDAPEPIKFEINTPKPILDKENIAFMEEVIISQETDNYKLILGKNEIQNNLIIKVVSDKTKEICFYQSNYNINDLQNLSEIFSFYKSIEIIISFLKTLKYEIQEKDENLKLKFNIFLPNGQNKLIELNLHKKLLNSNNIIADLLEENKLLKEDIYKNKNEISLLKEKF